MSDSLRALNRIDRLSTGFAVSQVLVAACDLGIFEELADAPRTSAEVADHIGLHPEGTRLVLDVLCAMELVAKSGHHYHKTAIGRYLQRSASPCLIPTAYRLTMFRDVWSQLGDVLRDPATPRQRITDVYAQEGGQDRFFALMQAYGAPTGAAVAEAIDFDACACVLDVGGGLGPVTAELLSRHQHLSATLLDRPEVCSLATRRFRDSGLGDRVSAKACDLFDPYPIGHDVVLLSSVLQDWSDDNCVRILRRCRDALPPDGKLLIVEAVVDEDGTAPLHALLMSLQMHLVCEQGAKERSLSQFRELFRQTGFGLDRYVDVGGPRALIVATSSAD